LIGCLQFAGFGLQAVGMKYTTASRSGFFTGLLVIMTPICAAIFRTSRAPLATWLSVPVALAGVYLLANPEAGGLNKGDVLTILCAVVFALQMVSLEWTVKGKDEGGRMKDEKGNWSENNHGLIDRARTPNQFILHLTYLQIVIVFVGAAIWSVVENRPFQITSIGIWALVYCAIFGSIFAVWAQTRYQPDVPAGHAALVFSLEPLFAALFAWLLLGDRWTPLGLVGGGLIIVAMMISSAKVGKHAPAQAVV
jgi:drug/metabolite transporter (DMT)-like permease